VRMQRGREARVLKSHRLHRSQHILVCWPADHVSSFFGRDAQIAA